MPAFIAALAAFIVSPVGLYMSASVLMGLVTYAGKRLVDMAVKRGK